MPWIHDMEAKIKKIKEHNDKLDSKNRVDYPYNRMYRMMKTIEIRSFEDKECEEYKNKFENYLDAILEGIKVNKIKGRLEDIHSELFHPIYLFLTKKYGYHDDGFYMRFLTYPTIILVSILYLMNYLTTNTAYLIVFVMFLLGIIMSFFDEKKI